MFKNSTMFIDRKWFSSLVLIILLWSLEIYMDFIYTFLILRISRAVSEELLSLGITGFTRPKFSPISTYL